MTGEKPRSQSYRAREPDAARYAAAQAAAERDGRTLADWLRRLVIAALREEDAAKALAPVAQESPR